MKNLILVFLSLASCFGFGAEFTKQFVQVSSDRKLWVEHKPAEAGKPTIVLLNGLTWSTREWAPYVEALSEIDPSLGIVLYDMEGQGQTLLDRAPVKWDIPFSMQVEDLKTLIDQLEIEGPLSVAGLSYGGAIALQFSAEYPDIFDHVIAMAPFLERLENQDQILNSWIKSHHLLYPLDPRSDDELYDYYLRILVYSTYHLSEPVILENPYHQEAVYRMVKGAKNFKAADLYGRLPDGKINIVGAIEDEHVKDDKLQEFWRGMTKNSQASYLRIEDTTHKIPEARPKIAAAWTYEILLGHSDLSKGLEWIIDPKDNIAKSGSCQIHLNNTSRP